MDIDVVKLRSESKVPHDLVKSKDGTIIFLRNWLTDSNTCFLILHGITAYSEPYGELAEKINLAGFSCVGMDLRGHGLSDGPRGDYSEDKLYDDLKAVYTHLRSKFEQIVLIGHSLGVITSGIMADKIADKLDGMILLSGARTVRDGAYPPRGILKTLRILFFSIFFPSKPVIHYYREGIRGLDDPIFNFHYTLRFLKVLNVKKFAFPTRCSYPVLVAVGDQDELFDADSCKKLLDEIPSDDKSFLVMPDTRHAFFSEHSFDGVIEWIETKFK